MTKVLIATDKPFAPVAVKGIQAARARNGNAEQFIGNMKSHERPVESGHGRIQPLAHGAAHQQIPGIGDQGDDGQLQRCGARLDQGKARIFPS